MGSWGYRTKCDIISISNDSLPLLLNLENSYYDDFTFDFGWYVNGNSSSGVWEIGNPNPTVENDKYIIQVMIYLVIVIVML